MTTTNPRRRIAPTLAALACATLVLAGCSSGDGDGGTAVDPVPQPVQPGTEGGAEPGELGAHDGEPCPESLPVGEQTDEYGFDTGRPAASRPDLAEAERAWICRYDSVATSPVGGGEAAADSAAPTWNRSLRANVAPGDLADVTAPLDRLHPAAADQMCTQELGPRYLLVTADAEGDLTGVAVDAYGCRDVRLTDEPYETAPGESEEDGVPAGVLSGPADLSELLADYVSSRAPE